MLAAAGCAALVGAATAGRLPISVTEALGSVTGLACVYLVVRRHIANFPIGIVSSFCFLLLFWGDRLFGDALLQVVFIALGFHGWHRWLQGGPAGSPLVVRRMDLRGLLLAAAAVGILSAGAGGLLLAARGSAPGLDAVTTALSLTAQYLLNRKLLQNWWFWMTADVLYLFLYVQRGFYLTAGLYAVFLVMCVFGLKSWLEAEAAVRRREGMCRSEA